MLIEWIEKTRKKPKAVRNQYAFIVSVCITTVIVSIWIISIPSRFNFTETSDQTAGAFSQFFGKAKQNFASVISSIKSKSNTATTSQDNSDNLSFDIRRTPTSSEQFIPTLKLNKDTVRAVNLQKKEQNLPKAHVVLIATTSTSNIKPSIEE